MNSNPSSRQQPVSNLKLTVLLVLMLIGFADAAFLAVEHYQGVIPPCGIVAGCETVTTSKYATIGPVSIALLGALYYLAMLVLLLMYWDTKNPVFTSLLFMISSLGFLVSLGLVGLQLFVIHAICIYCMVSATASIGSFGILVSVKTSSTPRIINL